MSGSRSRSRRRRGHDEEEHESHERWLVTYADMVTLLMVLFIIMFAMSTVDQEKYQALKNGLADGFGRSLNILNGASPQVADRGAIEPATASYDQLVNELPTNQRAKVQEVVNRTEQLRRQRQYADAKAEVTELSELWRRIRVALEKRGLQDDVQARIDERGLVVSLVSRHVVFRANLAELTDRGRSILDTLAPILGQLTERIEVDGHTNQVKVKPKYYPTDWELSAARAITALRYLNEVHGLPQPRLVASAFGHTKPIVDPSIAGSQAVNKRVDVIVLSDAPAETRALFAEVQADLGAVGAATSPSSLKSSPDPSTAQGAH